LGQRGRAALVEHGGRLIGLGQQLKEGGFALSLLPELFLSMVKLQHLGCTLQLEVVFMGGINPLLIRLGEMGARVMRFLGDEVRLGSVLTGKLRFLLLKCLMFGLFFKDHRGSSGTLTDNAIGIYIFKHDALSLKCMRTSEVLGCKPHRARVHTFYEGVGNDGVS
jgi:hypothetical protein